MTGPRVAPIGRLLVALERIERAQPPGVLIVRRIEATPGGVRVETPSGVGLELPASASTAAITASLRTVMPELEEVADDREFPYSFEPDVAVQWAQLHYALGAYERSILLDGGGVRLLSIERRGASAVVRIHRAPTDTIESYSVALDQEVDLGLADTIAFGSPS